MPVELATLGLRLSNEEAIADARATAQAYEEMGIKGEAAARKLTLSTNPAAAAIKDQGAATVAASRGMNAWSALQSEAAGHVGNHSLAIGQMERRLASAIEPMLGANKVVGLLSTSLLKFGIGSVETVGILAGVYAITWAWGKFTEELTKAAKAQDEMVVKLNASILGHVRGAGGELGDMITAGYGRISDIQDNQKYASRWFSRDLNPSTRADTKEANDSEIALLRLAIKSAETDKQLAEAKQYAGSVSTPYDRALSRGTSLDGFYSKALASEAQLSELAKSGTFEVRDAALQAMGTMEKIINHIKLIRMGLAEGPSQIFGMESGVVLGGMKQTNADITAGITSASLHGGDIKEFAGQILLLRKLVDTAAEGASKSPLSVRTQIQAQIDAVGLLFDALQLRMAPNAAGREGVAAGIRNAQGADGYLVNAEAQKKYGQSLAEREAALKLPDVFDSVREAAIKLAESLRDSGRKMDSFGNAWGFTRTGNVEDGFKTHFDPKAIGRGIQAGAEGGVADALSQFTPEALAAKGVTTILNNVAEGLTIMAKSLVDGGAAAAEMARQVRIQKDEYAAAVAQYKHDDLAGALATNMATFEQLVKQYLGTITVGDVLSGRVTAQSFQQQKADLAAQEAKNAAAIQRQAQYAQEDLVVRNLRATGQGDQADLLAFREQQQREYQAALDANRDQVYLNTLQTTQNNELIAYQNGLLSTAMRNAPTGFYGIESYLGAYATPRGYPTDSGTNPVSPVNPTGGLTPPGGGNGSPPPNRFTLVFQPGALVMDKNGVMNVVLEKIDQSASANDGAGSSRTDALNKMSRR
jgi:hypothetical protein